MSPHLYSHTAVSSTPYSIRLTARLLVKQLKDAVNRDQREIKLLYLLFDDGERQISAEAFSNKAVELHENLQVRSI